MELQHVRLGDILPSPKNPRLFGPDDAKDPELVSP